MNIRKKNFIPNKYLDEICDMSIRAIDSDGMLVILKPNQAVKVFAQSVTIFEEVDEIKGGLKYIRRLFKINKLYTQGELEMNEDVGQ